MAEKLKYLLEKLRFRYFLEKLLSFLRVRPFIGGMEISDLVLRFSYFDGKIWHFSGTKLEPGVVEAGKIKDRARFIEAARGLKAKAFGEKNLKERINTVVSLGSVNIYSQVFSLPIIKGENLDKAIQLNIQMASPIEASQAYSGWQKVGEDQKSLRIEILSAFIDKSIVDEINQILLEAGFLVVVIEPRALALTRLFKEQGSGFDPDGSYILVNIDDSGLDFLIIRRNQLYFEYFNPWRDIMDEKGQIPKAAFEAAVVRSLRQVINFYGQHWPEPVGEVALSATALASDATAIVGNNFALSVRELKLKFSQTIGPEWFVALGCGLRGIKSRANDKEMSLLGVGAEEEFRREQLINFLSLWRLAIPITLIFLAVSFFLADLFLIRTRTSLESQLLSASRNEQAEEGQTLAAAALNFNRSVALIAAVQKTAMFKGGLWERVSGLATGSGVLIDHLAFQSPDNPLTLSGQAKSEDQIAAFKKALDGDPMFVGTDLPLTGIKQVPGGVSFSMTFRLRM